MQFENTKQVLIIGAGGNLGSKLTDRGLALGHEVTVLVRNAESFLARSGLSRRELSIVVGDASDANIVARALEGKDAMVSAAGKVTEGVAFTELFSTIVGAAEQARSFGGRVWMLAGAAALMFPGTQRFIADLPGAPGLYQAHVKNARRLQSTALDWSLMCPGPMLDGPPTPPRSDLRITTDVSPLDLGRWRQAPGLVQTLMLRLKLGELVVRYEDVANIIMSRLDREGPFSGRRVGVALPPGETARKDRWNPASQATSR
jgi:putative NADH-flavin reductase